MASASVPFRGSSIALLLRFFMTAVLRLSALVQTALFLVRFSYLGKG